MDTKGKSVMLLEEPQPNPTGFISSADAAAAAAALMVLPDCPHFLRMGACKFGNHCQYNHPNHPLEASAIIEKHLSLENATAAGKTTHSGGSTSRMVYKSSQPRNDTDLPFPTLNQHGLPIRLGEKKCLHYLRYGYCGYGVRCMFHHPGPKFVNYNYSSCGKGKGMEMEIHSNGGVDQSPGLLPPPSSHQPPKPNPNPNPNPNPGRPWLPYPYPTTNYPNANTANCFPPPRPPQWIPYQAPSYVPAKSVVPPPNPVAKGAEKKPDTKKKSTTKVEGFIEYSDQPICVHLLRTGGDCVFKSACRFHHPKNWISRRDDCVLSDKGLPLRPDKEVCRHYRSFGLCKSGPTCVFDHPIALQLPPIRRRRSKTKEGECSTSTTKEQ